MVAVQRSCMRLSNKNIFVAICPIGILATGNIFKYLQSSFSGKHRTAEAIRWNQCYNGVFSFMAQSTNAVIMYA